MKEYELPLGVYRIRDALVPLKDFNISVTVNSFKDETDNVFLKNERLSLYPGKTFPVLGKKLYDFTILNEGKEENLDPKLFNITFSKPGFDNFNVDKFIQQLKVADITKEFQQVAQTLVYGYLEHHVNDEKPYMDALKQWLKKDADSFMLLSETKKQGRSYYFPSGTSDEFKQVMKNALKEHPRHLKVLDDYCNDWSLTLDKSNKPKKPRI